MKPTKKNLRYLFHQSNLIEGFNDPLFDEQQMVAWEYLSEVSLDQLDHHCICKVQKIITIKQDDLKPDWRGYYRSKNGVNVTVAGRPGMAPKKIDMAMTRWLVDLDNGDPHQSHIEFEHIHPFVDGNGRTGRMLMWWHQMRLGQPLTKITYEERGDYYKWFREPDIEYYAGLAAMLDDMKPKGIDRRERPKGSK